MWAFGVVGRSFVKDGEINMGIFRNSIRRNLIPLTTGRQVGALLICAVAAVLMIAGSASAQTSNFFDWQDQTNLPPNSGSVGAYNYVYVPAPILTDSNIAAVQTYFNNALTANPGAVLAVKVTGPILVPPLPQSLTITMSAYVFGDFEGSGTVEHHRSLRGIGHRIRHLGQPSDLAPAAAHSPRPAPP